MCNMGFCFKDGTGCEKNMKKAVEFYEKAANLGHSEGIMRFFLKLLFS